MTLIVKINYDYDFSYVEYRNLFFNLKNHKQSVLLACNKIKNE